MPDVIINGPEGRLEGRYHHGQGQRAPMALLLHPHPQHGGTMNNKVVYTLYPCLRARRLFRPALQFPRRRQQPGRFDRGEGELSDAAAALDWLQTYNPNAESLLDRRLFLRRLDRHAAVDAAAGDRRLHRGGAAGQHCDFSFLPPCPASGLIVQGDQDQIVPPEAVQKLVTSWLQGQRDIASTYRVIAGADHFFAGRLEQLGAVAERYISGNRHRRPAKAI